MGKKLKCLLVVVLSLMLLFCSAACGSSEDETTDSAKTSDKAEIIKADAEKAAIKAEDGVIKVDIPTRHFIGTWTADSGKAEHLFGNLTITLNEDNTWNGTVTDEELHGTWEERDFGVHLYDEVELWECDLFYTDKDNFVLNEDGIKVVLTMH